MPTTRVPWHHWPVAFLAVVFYAVGSVDFVFTYLSLPFYSADFTDNQRVFYNTLPSWLNMLWAVGTIGGLAGAYMFYRRVRFSVIVLFLAFAALIFVTLWLTIIHRPSLVGAMGFLGLWFMAGTCALSFLIYTYARWERVEQHLT